METPLKMETPPKMKTPLKADRDRPDRGDANVTGIRLKSRPVSA
jgi:hypothetical protein